MEAFALTDEREARAHVIEACRRGERDAFRRLFETHRDRVYSVALYFFGGDEATASDVTQQVFVKLFDKIGQFHGDAEFTTWLYRMATNACIDEQRKRRRFLPFGDAFARDEPRVKTQQED